MNLSLSRADLMLRPDQLIGLVDAVGARVDVRRGKVWITQYDDARDLMVAAGRGFTLDRPGLALVHALEATEVALTEPADPGPAPWWMRFARTLGNGIASIFGPDAVDRYHPGPARRYL